ncbi:MAG: hypothetical protein AAGA05_14745 [Pseudomonadota bacterium]
MLISAVCAPPALAILAAPLPEDGPRLVLYPPWVDGADLVQQAGGDSIGPYRAPMGVLAFASDSEAFDRRLRAAGAWAVIDGTIIANLCGLGTDGSLKGMGT